MESFKKQVLAYCLKHDITIGTIGCAIKYQNTRHLKEYFLEGKGDITLKTKSRIEKFIRE